MLKRNIENELNLSPRIVHILNEDAEIKTVGQLLKWDRADLMGLLPGIGAAAVNKISGELQAAIERRIGVGPD